jgi:leader peptidase (prepilin peptidase) / N-methyltransferase
LYRLWIYSCNQRRCNYLKRTRDNTIDGRRQNRDNIDNIMIIQLAILLTLAGLAIGSFLNVCIDRLPERKSLIKPPSHCDSCGRKLTILDNIPIFSYLFLRGKCRTCGAHIPLRVLLVEVLTAGLFLAAYWRLGLTVNYAISLLWICIFIVIIFIDWEKQLILNVITYPAAIIAVILLAVDSFVPGADLFGGRLFLPHNALYSGLISGGVLFLFFIVIVIITPGSMGMGDAKLVAVIGLMSGFPLMIFSMLIGIVLGGIVAIILLVTRKKKRKDVIPYGTFLAIGPIIALLLPGGLMDWYLSFGVK